MDRDIENLDESLIHKEIETKIHSSLSRERNTVSENNLDLPFNNHPGIVGTLSSNLNHQVIVSQNENTNLMISSDVPEPPPKNTKKITNFNDIDQHIQVSKVYDSNDNFQGSTDNDTSHVNTIDSNSFKELGLSDILVDVLSKVNTEHKMGILRPTKVQDGAIPLILAKTDIIIKSQTGSGKTLAFVLPILHMLTDKNQRTSRNDGISALILSPTRELCFQIFQVLELLVKSFYWLVVGSLVGGEKRKSEKARLRKGINILVGTPGRLIDHLQHTERFQDSLKRGKLRWLVLDEVDRLTDGGFIQQITLIFDWLKENNILTFSNSESKKILQIIIVSATLSPSVKEFAKRILQNPVLLDIQESSNFNSSSISQTQESSYEKFSKSTKASELAACSPIVENFSEIPITLTQHYVLVDSKDRLVLLCAFILRQVKCYHYSIKIILFVSCRNVVDFLYAILKEIEWPPSNRYIFSDSQNQGLGTKWWKLHGNMDQKERRRVISEFSSARNGVLICTDVAARGLDVPQTDWIIQYDAPSELSDYIHRIGRTARSGKHGSSLLFLRPSEIDYLTILPKGNSKIIELQKKNIISSLSKYCVFDDTNENESKKSPHNGNENISNFENRNNNKRKYEGNNLKGILARSRADPDAAVALFHLKINDLVENIDTLEKKISENKNGSPVTKKVKRERSTHSNFSKFKLLAEEAFVAYVRAYAVHSKDTKQFFHPKNLHLGHVAKSFGLLEEPKSVSNSSRFRHKHHVKKKKQKLIKKIYDKASLRHTRSNDL